MKCPKCSYLGFETGDRCKNCGYDFSLLAGSAPAASDLDLALRPDDPREEPADLWLGRLDQSFTEASQQAVEEPGPMVADPMPAALPVATRVEVPAAEPPAFAASGGTPLPLFKSAEPDDAPMITVPAAPRPPLSVRRTPETPRLRAMPRVARQAEPGLQFADDPAALLMPDLDLTDPLPAPRPAESLEGARNVGGRRLVAGALDHAILLAIDAAVVYFTLRMAGLTTAEIGVLPPAPLVTFLVLLKAAYFVAFTAVGGQTIGKMAAGIRVVGEHGGIDGGLAVRRTLATLLSLLPLGLGMVPAFFGDRRALHDRLTGTRVVGLP